MKARLDPTLRAAMVTGSILLVLAAAAACSSTTHPGLLNPGDGGPAADPDGGYRIVTDAADESDADDGHVVPDDGPVDDAALDAPPAACNMLGAEGPVVPETHQSAPFDAPIGGDIVPGKYWLTERDWFDDPEGSPDPDDGVSHQRVLTVDATTFQATNGILALSGAGPVTYSYTTGEFNVHLAEICPLQGGDTNVRFSVQGNEVWLFTEVQRREIYTFQP